MSPDSSHSTMKLILTARINKSDSEIFFRMNLTNEGEFNMTEVKGFLSEINQVRELNLSIGDIKSVIYITWVNLQQFPGILAEVSVKYVSFIF